MKKTIERKILPCKYLRQQHKSHPPYCMYKGYCEKMWNYANVKYCKEKLEWMTRKS